VPTLLGALRPAVKVKREVYSLRHFRNARTCMHQHTKAPGGLSYLNENCKRYVVKHNCVN